MKTIITFIILLLNKSIPIIQNNNIKKVTNNGAKAPISFFVIIDINVVIDAIDIVHKNINIKPNTIASLLKPQVPIITQLLIINDVENNVIHNNIYIVTVKNLDK